MDALSWVRERIANEIYKVIALSGISLAEIEVELNWDKKVKSGFYEDLASELIDPESMSVELLEHILEAAKKIAKVHEENMNKDPLEVEIDCAIENIVDYIDRGIVRPPQLETWLKDFAKAIIRKARR